MVFLLLVVFVIKQGQGRSHADTFVRRVHGYGRSLCPGGRLRLVVVGGTRRRSRCLMLHEIHRRRLIRKQRVRCRLHGSGRGGTPHFQSLAKNPSTARSNSVGFSRVSQWPHCGRTDNSESSINVCALRAHERGTYLSSAPWRIRVGTARV